MTLEALAYDIHDHVTCYAHDPQLLHWTLYLCSLKCLLDTLKTQQCIPSDIIAFSPFISSILNDCSSLAFFFVSRIGNPNACCLFYLSHAISILLTLSLVSSHTITAFDSSLLYLLSTFLSFSCQLLASHNLWHALLCNIIFEWPLGLFSTT